MARAARRRTAPREERRRACGRACGGAVREATRWSGGESGSESSAGEPYPLASSPESSAHPRVSEAPSK
ncbi:hypothetical protein GUJ93_ZPchr0011g28098 [Zizania palustris]|uniref:Uncharacterized protein n=1 Tax=Zizania palustris TaxID=103762 RepID=A0A8J5WGP0_ZIZPA|nr:hypothetical protein GUJ93_ZPchr0011g28098 [Zizania palustris]